MTAPHRRLGRPVLRLSLLSFGATALVLALTSANAGATAGSSAAAQRPTMLSTGTRPGPTAVSDAQGNTYTFWRGPHGQLWDDRYTASAKPGSTAEYGVSVSVSAAPAA
jgi:hypothetical protein